MNLSDSFRTWRRRLKARLPYVRRREHHMLQVRHSELIDCLGWSMRPATDAAMHALKPVAGILDGDVCFFVSFAPKPVLKRHVKIHIEHLIRSGIRVVLVLNTALRPDQILVDTELLERLSGLYIRENIGFDFAAWAHLHNLLADQVCQWRRLFLINDSIVGPLGQNEFDRLIKQVRSSNADLVGLVESCSPLRHLQSFFLVFNRSALVHPAVQLVFSRILSLPTKEQVIDVYETRLTQMLINQGLQCESVFLPLTDDCDNSNDTIHRWAQLIAIGFPYIKASLIAKFEGNPKIHRFVQKEFLPSEKSDRD